MYSKKDKLIILKGYLGTFIPDDVLRVDFVTRKVAVSKDKWGLFCNCREAVKNMISRIDNYIVFSSNPLFLKFFAASVLLDFKLQGSGGFIDFDLIKSYDLVEAFLGTSEEFEGSSFYNISGKSLLFVYNFADTVVNKRLPDFLSNLASVRGFDSKKTIILTESEIIKDDKDNLSRGQSIVNILPNFKYINLDRVFSKFLDNMSVAPKAKDGSNIYTSPKEALV